MIDSMTAFGRGEHAAEGWRAAVEIRSVNSRYLDLVVRLPHGYTAFEERIKTRVGRDLERGRVELRLSVHDERRHENAFQLDLPAAAAFHRALLALGEGLGLEGPIPLAVVAGAPGVIRPGEAEPDLEGDWPGIAAALDTALADLKAMRRREGTNLATDLQRRLDRVAAEIDAIQAATRSLAAHYRQRLEARIAALTEGLVALDPARIAQEAAILADRSDISEEIVRARSHLEQFRHLMGGPKAAGRQLNFLLQELNRELNTIGSKTDQAGAAHRVVAAKAELEKLREQVQNVE